MIELLKNKEPSLFDILPDKPLERDVDSEPSVMFLADIIVTAIQEYKEDIPTKIKELELAINERISNNISRHKWAQKAEKLEELKRQLRNEREWLFCRKKDGVAFDDLCEMINDWLDSHGCEFNVSPRKIREQYGIV